MTARSESDSGSGAAAFDEVCHSAGAWQAFAIDQLDAVVVAAIIMPVMSNELTATIDTVTVVTERITLGLLFDPVLHELLLEA